MKQFYASIILLLLTGQNCLAQNAADVAVQVSAVTQVSPPQVQLSWKPLKDTPTYYIYRKSKTGTSWGNVIATLPSTDTSYTDINVVADSAYEYFIKANGRIPATGFIYAGIQAPPIHNRGTLLLLVDSTFTDSSAVAINTLMDDISGDGYGIIRHDLPRTMPDTDVHAIIVNDYNSNPNVTAVMIVGHIAVPYSGNENPDGHPDHLGAWPADVYYGNINGPWTDNTILDTSAGYAANRNRLYDGKWDQVLLPSVNQLQVGRIDVYNMPAFHKPEVLMMNTYLAKDHLYKMDSLAMKHRGLIYDNFGYFSGEAFAANGWRNFPPLLGRNNIQTLPFIASLNDSTYQWAYGCGGGSFTTASGIGSTQNFDSNNVNAIFTMLFGSYFGDWNVQNNFLRAPLCSNVPALTSCWAGRPNWFMHHMALGEAIGYSALLTQNNTGLYFPAGYGVNWVHVALMGDLSLRTDYINPASNMAISGTPAKGATITWAASPDPQVIGYYVYVSNSRFGTYTKVSPFLTSLTYQDSLGTDGLKFYMVRPVKLVQTASGSYYNLGIGITDTATITYSHVGVATVTRIQSINLYPNPATSVLNLSVTTGSPVSATIAIINQTGQVVMTVPQQFNSGQNHLKYSVGNLLPGYYTISISAGTETNTTKWVKLD